MRLQILYADTLFLSNLVMNLLALSLTGRVMHLKGKRIRLYLSSALGGVYSVSILFIEMGTVVSVALDVVMCAAMCLIAFKMEKGGFHTFVMTSAVFFAASVAVGGLMTVMFDFLNRIELPLVELNNNGDGVSVWLFAILAMISGVAATYSGRIFKKLSGDTMMSIVIEYKGKRISTTGMTDTGNLLKEPMSGRYVILLDSSVSVSLLGERCAELAMAGNITAIINEDRSHRVRLLPISTASGSSSLCAFVPDSLVLVNERGVRKDADALFAPLDLSLGVEWKALGCGALIPASII